MFKHDYPILVEIDPQKEQSEQIFFSGQNRYYKNEKCALKGVEYYYTSQLYGLGEKATHEDNRTPLWNWVCDKLGLKIDTKVESDNWLPKLKDYSPGISKERWLELLNDNNVFETKHLVAMACMYDNGGQGSCSELAGKYNKSMTLWRTVCGYYLSERVAQKTKCKMFEEDKKKLYYVIPFMYRKTKSDEEGSYIYKLRSELYDALTEFGIQKYLPVNEEKMNTKESIEYIKNYIQKRAFSYNNKLIEDFYLSLKTKPFVILAGISGTGKTKLVELFVEALVGEDNTDEQFILIPVRPDWSDSSDLLGHFDLYNQYVSTEIVEFIVKANENLDKPYFLCLDEMNLARVEYYLSDILSIIETRSFDNEEIIRTKSLFANGKNIPEKIKNAYLSENLFIVGTVNMDETTFPFSKKVLDRANTIEFSEVDSLIPDFTRMNAARNASKTGIDINNNSFLKSKYITILDCEQKDHHVKHYCNILQDINDILKTVNAHVGYRVRDEIVFYMLYNEEDNLLAEDEAMDNSIMQKILPRIQGNGLEIKSLIESLENYCKSNNYVKSAAKLKVMKARCGDYGEGYTSYWL